MGSSRSTNTSWTNHILPYFQLYASYFFLLPNCVVWLHLSSGKKQCDKGDSQLIFTFVEKASIHSLTSAPSFFKIVDSFIFGCAIWLWDLFPTEIWFPTRPWCQTPSPSSDST